MRKIVAEKKMRQSTSSTGNCYDNAPAESFFATFKKSHLFWQPFQTKEEARRKIEEYLTVFYNPVRPLFTREQITGGLRAATGVLA